MIQILYALRRIIASSAYVYNKGGVEMCMLQNVVFASLNVKHEPLKWYTSSLPILGCFCHCGGQPL